MKFEPGTEYKTRDGRRARVYAVDGEGSYPIHGAHESSWGGWAACVWTADGKFYGNLTDDQLDLMYEDVGVEE